MYGGLLGGPTGKVKGIGPGWLNTPGGSPAHFRAEERVEEGTEPCERDC